MPVNKKISEDTSFTVISCLLIEFSLRIIAMILSFVHRSVESFHIYLFNIVLSIIIAINVFKVDHLFPKAVIISHLSISISIPVAYYLATLQCFVGQWTYHDIIFLPPIMRVISIIFVITDVFFVIFVWIMFSMHKSKDNPPDDGIGLQSWKEQTIHSAIFTVPENIFSGFASQPLGSDNHLHIQ